VPTKQLTISIVGAGGDGVVTLGDMLAEASAREGLHVIKTDIYGAQIRGGECSSTLRIGAAPIFAPGDLADVLVVFSQADFARFRGDVRVGDRALVFREDEPAAATSPDAGAVALPAGARSVVTPFESLSSAAGNRGAKNILALGLLCQVLGLPRSAVRDAVSRRFKRADEKTTLSNQRAFDAGVAFAGELGPLPERLDYLPGEARPIMSGNDASAIGVIHAGCRFFAGYPITPSSEMLHFLTEWLPKLGGSAIQTEDELSAIAACVGASFAGRKAMTATSGPGLSLMTEMLGLASMAEVPVVVVDVQRGGPSTGLPTKAEQSDLYQAVYAGHGDGPRVVLACANVEESFHATVDAFNIAEEFQLPVIVLSDQAVAQRRETVATGAFVHEVRERATPDAADLDSYERYRMTESGVSAMAIPGTRGVYQTNGLEHDVHGQPSANYRTHERMNEKRFRKLGRVLEKYGVTERIGDPEATVGILAWGSSCGPVREAVARATSRGQKVAALFTRLIHPYPAMECARFIEPLEHVLIVEVSYASQFYHHLRASVPLPEGRTHVYKRSGGKALTAEEVELELEQLRTHADRNEEAVA
jgi:2-oxoglutarate ferredoxin oxidoreductase subunit alpha